MTIAHFADGSAEYVHDEPDRDVWVVCRHDPPDPTLLYDPKAAGVVARATEHVLRRQRVHHSADWHGPLRGHWSPTYGCEVCGRPQGLAKRNYGRWGAHLACLCGRGEGWVVVTGRVESVLVEDGSPWYLQHLGEGLLRQYLGDELELLIVLRDAHLCGATFAQLLRMVDDAQFLDDSAILPEDLRTLVRQWGPP